MSNNSLKILEQVSDYLLDNPKESFCQAMLSIGINEITVNGNDWWDWEDILNNSNDTDEVVLERIKEKTLTLWDLPY